MVERVKVTITPAAIDSDLLKVEDAAKQLLDIFSAIGKIDETIRGDNPPVMWCLSKVSMNSPLEATAVAYSKDPAYIPDMQAHKSKSLFQNGVETILSGGKKPTWMVEEVEKKIKDIFLRNMNGIGRTDILMNEQSAPLIITSKTAQTAIINLQTQEMEERTKEFDFTHTAYGSIEGFLIKAERHYNKPSIVIWERILQREVRCLIESDVEEEEGAKHNLAEVWAGKRLLVEGRLQYDSDGNIAKVSARHITTIEPKPINFMDIYDPDFTGKTSTVDYINSLGED